MGGAVGARVGVVRLPYLLRAVGSRSRRAACISPRGGVIARAIVRATVGSISAPTGAIVTAMPSGVPVVGPAMINRGAAVPIAIPTAISPAAATTAHHRSHCHSNAEGKHTRGYQVSGAIAGNDIGSAVNHGWVVLWDIDNLGVGWLNDDGLRRLLDNGDLRTRVQIAGGLGFRAQGLDRRHDVGLLVVVILTQL